MTKPAQTQNETRLKRLERLAENVLYAQLGGHFQQYDGAARAALDELRNVLYEKSDAESR